MTGAGAVLRKLVHQVAPRTLAVVVVTTPIMAHLVRDDEYLLAPNDGDSPARKAADTSVVYDAFANGRICKSCQQIVS